MKKTYRNRSIGTSIDVFDVERETEATVWIKRGEKNKTKQYRKMSDVFRFFDTIEEAKKHLTYRYLKDIEYHEKQIERSKESIKKVNEIE